MSYHIEVQNLQKSVPLDESMIVKTAQDVLEYMKVARASLSIIILTNRRLHAINRKFLAHDYPTDVITFDLTEDELSRSQKAVRKVDGEICISAVMAKANAKLFQMSAHEEIRLYLVHGVLHLLGYDDHGAAAKKRMRAKEKEILKFLENKG